VLVPELHQASGATGRVQGEEKWANACGERLCEDSAGRLESPSIQRWGICGLVPPLPVRSHSLLTQALLSETVKKNEGKERAAALTITPCVCTWKS